MLLTFLYFAVVLAGSALALYLLLAGRSHILRLQIAGVALATALWGLWHLLAPPQASWSGTGEFFGELLLLIGWYGLIERLLRGPYQQSLPLAVRNGLRWAWLIVLLFVLSAIVGRQWMSRLLDIGDVLLMALLALALLAQALAAQVYGDAVVEPNFRLRNICSAATFALSSMVLLGGVTLLVVQVPEWLQIVRCAAVFLSLYLLASSLQGNPQWALAIFVSPQARVYAPRVLSVAVVLLLLVAAAPLFRNSPPMQSAWLPVLTVGSLLAVLLVLLFSERVRAQLRVYGSKQFLPFRYDYRGEWLRLIDTLATPDQATPLSERAILALAQIVGSPAGGLWLIDDESASFECIEAWNTKKMTEVSVPVGDPAVEFMRTRNWILDTLEWRRKPELYPGVTRPEWLSLFPESLLIVPLLSGDDAIGFVVLVQPDNRFRLTFEEIDLLRTSGRQVAAHLAQFQADRQLAQSKQFEAFNRLTAFVMHDLKNLIAQQSLMVKNAAKHKDNPEFFKDAMATIDHSVTRMQKLLQQLQTGEAAGPKRDVSLKTCVEEAIQKCAGRSPDPALASPEETIDVHIDPERFTSILAHLIRNAQDATDSDGEVRIELSMDNGLVKILIIDDGCGMEEEFVRSRLFRPFDTTKGSQGMGIGAYQARSFIVASGGTMIVRSVPRQGTIIDMEIPAVQSEALDAH